MMSHFAVIEDNAIVNLIVAEDLETAESVSGKTCVEYNQDEVLPAIGWELVDGSVVDPNPKDIEYIEIAE